MGRDRGTLLIFVGISDDHDVSSGQTAGGAGRCELSIEKDFLHKALVS